MSSILITGVIQGDVYFYTGQKQGGGYVVDTSVSKNFLHAARSMKPGVYMTVIVGLGSHNVHYVYAPLSRSVWFAIGAKYGIEILPGTDLAKISVNMSHARDHREELMELAAGMVAYIGQSDPSYGGEYSPEFAYADFCVTLTPVSVPLKKIIKNINIFFLLSFHLNIMKLFRNI